MKELFRAESGEPNIFRFRCRCGRTFYMAVRVEEEVVFSIAAGPGEAVAALFEKLQRFQTLEDIEIPDCLPPEI